LGREQTNNHCGKKGKEENKGQNRKTKAMRFKRDLNPRKNIIQP
jgi:hypothetical protein